MDKCFSGHLGVSVPVGLQQFGEMLRESLRELQGWHSSCQSSENHFLNSESGFDIVLSFRKFRTSSFGANYSFLVLRKETKPLMAVIVL